MLIWGLLLSLAVTAVLWVALHDWHFFALPFLTIAAWLLLRFSVPQGSYRVVRAGANPRRARPRGDPRNAVILPRGFAGGERSQSAAAPRQENGGSVKLNRGGSMAERKTLVEALKPEGSMDRTVEEDFVFNNKPKSSPAARHQPPAPVTDIGEGKARTGSTVSRVPFTTRLRTDYSTALKRASLERQLKGVFPNTLQDMLEEALQPWLRSNGYLN
jgi:hypothetical protein